MFHLLRSVCVIAIYCLSLGCASPRVLATEATVPANPTKGMEFRDNVQVPMRDGVLLATDITLPENKGPFPTIILRTPFTVVLGRAVGREFGREFAALGYVFVHQECRGTGRSQGEWEPFLHERDDGIDLHRWVEAQPWCNGKIATFGASYCGYTQWAAAYQADASLKAMMTDVPAFNPYELYYLNGAFRLRTGINCDCTLGSSRSGHHPFIKVNQQTQPWTVELNRSRFNDVYRHLPLRTWDERIGVKIPWIRETLARPEFDPYWASRGMTDKLNQIGSPNLTCTGWYDLLLSEALHYVPQLRENAASETARRHQHLIIGPWGHMLNEPIGELPFGDDAKIDLVDLRKKWFGYWLKEEATGVDSWPFLRIFVMGANHWRDENTWPLEGTQFKKYYFHSDGRANTLKGDGRMTPDQPGMEPQDHYLYDPNDPVPSQGGEWSMTAPCGPFDQQSVESREDVLVYTSEELMEPLEVTGPIKVILYAASSAADTDWTGKLVDVHPDGRAFNLCEGIIRARYRESLIKAKLLQPEKIYRYEIDLWATSNLFKASHRIRVEISSSNFPRFDRNPNTGNSFGVDAELKKARQTVYHDQEYPSYILLPVISRPVEVGVSPKKVEELSIFMQSLVDQDKIAGGVTMLAHHGKHIAGLYWNDMPQIFPLMPLSLFPGCGNYHIYKTTAFIRIVQVFLFSSVDTALLQFQKAIQITFRTNDMEAIAVSIPSNTAAGSGIAILTNPTLVSSTAPKPTSSNEPNLIRISTSVDCSSKTRKLPSSGCSVK